MVLEAGIYNCVLSIIEKRCHGFKLSRIEFAISDLITGQSAPELEMHVNVRVICVNIDP